MSMGRWTFCIVYSTSLKLNGKSSFVECRQNISINNGKQERVVMGGSYSNWIEFQRSFCSSLTCIIKVNWNENLKELKVASFVVNKAKQKINDKSTVFHVSCF